MLKTWSVKDASRRDAVYKECACGFYMVAIGCDRWVDYMQTDGQIRCLRERPQAPRTPPWHLEVIPLQLLAYPLAVPKTTDCTPH